MWFAVHTVMKYRFLDTSCQAEFCVYENIYLVDSIDFQAARDAATSLAVSEATGLSEPAKVNGRPARLEFDGIRKVIMVQTVEETGAMKITTGAEATYLELYFDSFDEYQKYRNGEAAWCQIS